MTSTDHSGDGSVTLSEIDDTTIDCLGRVRTANEIKQRDKERCDCLFVVACLFHFSMILVSFILFFVFMPKDGMASPNMAVFITSTIVLILNAGPWLIASVCVLSSVLYQYIKMLI
jgi:hypothetical protein